MAIDVFEFYHGSALTKLLNYGERLVIKTFPSDSNATFSIGLAGKKDEKEQVAIYIKYSKKRMTPWVFTFKKKHQEELQVINDLHKKTFLVLVCGHDGVICIEYSKLKSILDENYGIAEWVKVHRYRREHYQFSGSDGKLSHKMSRKVFPLDIIKALKK